MLFYSLVWYLIQKPISNKDKEIISLSIREIYSLKKINNKSRKELGQFHWIITDVCLGSIKEVSRCKNIGEGLYLTYFLKTPEIIERERQINLIKSMEKEMILRNEEKELNIFDLPNFYLFL